MFVDSLRISNKGKLIESVSIRVSRSDFRIDLQVRLDFGRDSLQ